MMRRPVPPIDRRTAADIAAQFDSLLAVRLPGWQGSAPGSAAAALIGVFSHYAELLAERLNRAPEHKLLAFLNAIGAAQLPPRPARVPLTFSLASGSVSDGLVPAGTQASAPPSGGGAEPVVFETDADLFVSASPLVDLFVRDAAADLYSDYCGLLVEEASPPAPLFEGDKQIEHVLWVGHSDMFGVQPLKELRVTFDLRETTGLAQTVQWELKDGEKTIALTPFADETSGLTRGGDVVFRDVPAAEPLVVNGLRKRWICCRLLTLLAGETHVQALTLDRDLDYRATPSIAFINGIPIDLAKDFYPLGETPVFGNTLHLSIDAKYAVPGSTLTVRLDLTNSATGGGSSPLPPVNTTRGARIAWEFWNGTRWRELGVGHTEALIDNPSSGFRDATRALTGSGEVSVRFPEQAQSIELFGLETAWLRARLIYGDYGKPAEYVVRPGAAGAPPEYVYQPATVAAPAIRTMELVHQLHQAAVLPEAVLAYNDFAFSDGLAAVNDPKTGFTVFVQSPERRPALYLGFRPPARGPFTSNPVSVYFSIANTLSAQAANESLPSTPLVIWEYWNGTRWSRSTVVDDTRNFTRSAAVRLMPPPDLAPRHDFGRTGYWFRALWRGGSRYTTAPLRRVLVNTASATQAVTLTAETLASGNGTPDQVMRTARSPVLEGQRLEVRESARLGSAGERWVEWTRVPDFYASGPLDRHYVLDALTGVVRFGNGVHGAVPPSGNNNVRMARYRSGGGAAGNVPARSVTQLKTTIPYVDAVTNHEPASGGADAETTAQLLDRAPRTLRHQNRAVTVEDFEDLARIASPEVARARCVPLYNLALDPDGAQLRPGVVSVIVVPHSHDRKPFPNVELIRCVAERLQAAVNPSVAVVVVGPEYVEVVIEAEIVVRSLDRLSEIDARIKGLLNRFLDPFLGGQDGQGWDFGREPHRSDLYPLISSVGGVDFVRSLRMTQVEDRQGAAKTSRFLTTPGAIKLLFSLEGR